MHYLIPTSSFTSSFVVPDDGDARTALSVNGPFQALLNNTTLLFNGLPSNFLCSQPIVSASSGGNVSGSTQVYIGPSTMVLGGVVYNQKAKSIGVGFINGGSIAAGVYYYLYATASSGVVIYTGSVNPPAGGVDSTDPNSLYIGSLRAWDSSHVVPFLREGDTTLLADYASNISSNNAPASTSTQVVSCFGAVPSHVKTIYVQITTTAPDGMGAPTLNIGAAEEPAFSFYGGDDKVTGTLSGSTWVAKETIWQPLDGTQKFRFNFTTVNATGSFLLRGYKENN